MKFSSLLILLLVNTFCVFSQNKIPHELVCLFGCFKNGTCEVGLELDAQELVFVDFDREVVTYTVPRFFMSDPSELFDNSYLYNDALTFKRSCSSIVELCNVIQEMPPEEKDPPEIIIYPAEEVQLEAENSLICYMNHFYPPEISVSWTKNNVTVSEGVSLSRYYSNSDQTFRQLSTLTFTPRQGDVYSCTVEHAALDRPVTKTWNPEPEHPSFGPNIFCGVSLSLGLLGVITGTILYG